MKVIIQKNQQILVNELQIANSYFSRFAGLMFRKQLSSQSGLLIAPCKQIHTHFMRFAIDVIFINKRYEVLHIEHSLKPWRISKYIKHAHAVIEVNKGQAASVAVGDQLQLAD